MDPATLSLIAAAIAKAVVPEVLDRLRNAGNEHTDRVRRNADIADAVEATLAANPAIATEAVEAAGLGHLITKG